MSRRVMGRWGQVSRRQVSPGLEGRGEPGTSRGGPWQRCVAAGRAGRRPDGAGSPAPAGPEDPPQRARPGVEAEGGHGAGATWEREGLGTERVYVTMETDAQELGLKTPEQRLGPGGWCGEKAAPSTVEGGPAGGCVPRPRLGASLRSTG